MKHSNSTGANQKNAPLHWDLMNSFFGGRHSNVPVQINESQHGGPSHRVESSPSGTKRTHDKENEPNTKKKTPAKSF